MYDLIIIGGGPAGLAAATRAKEEGINKLLIIEREDRLGGILNQCIHPGFGLHLLKEELTGPEYAYHFIQVVEVLQIPYLLSTTAVAINTDKEVTIVSEKGLEILHTKAIILAMGCRERPRGAIQIPGSRVAGIYAAGTAQKLVNKKGKLPGKQVVIVGSGDIGLIMARRMSCEGAKVMAVVEIMPYSNGLKRNIVQCLEDFHIPLKLSHTVTCIHGQDRVEGVTIATLDEKRRPIPGTESFIACDTVLFSVGLLPENELSTMAGVALGSTGGPAVDENLETNVEGIFACGNVLHVHDVVDFVTEESYEAGTRAVAYLKGIRYENQKAKVVPGVGIRYVIPSSIHQGTSIAPIHLKWRVDNVYQKVTVGVYFDEKQITSKKYRVVVPSEMQQIVLPKDCYQRLKETKKIEIRIEGGSLDGANLY